MTKLIDLLDQLKHRRTFGFMDDFDSYTTAQRWTSVLSHSGSIAVADGVGGILTLAASGGSVAANDESYARTTSALFQFAANKPLLFEAAVQFTEANTNEANILIGLMDGVAAGALADGNAGPKASYSGMVFFKAGGGNVWGCQTSVGASQSTVATSKPAGGAHFQTLTGQWQPISSTQAEAAFFIDGLLVARQLFTFTGAVPMQLCAGVKNGSGILETLNVDYLAAYQLR
jgi:hypothetical protein